MVPRRLAEELGLKPHRVGKVWTGAGLIGVRRAAVTEVAGREL